MPQNSAGTRITFQLDGTHHPHAQGSAGNRLGRFRNHSEPRFGVLIIRYDWRNNSVLFIHNFDSKPREISFSTGLTGEDIEPGRLLNLLSEDHSRGDKKGRHRLVIEGYGYRWYRVGGLDYLLRRAENKSTRVPGTD